MVAVLKPERSVLLHNPFILQMKDKIMQHLKATAYFARPIGRALPCVRKHRISRQTPFADQAGDFYFMRILTGLDDAP